MQGFQGTDRSASLVAASDVDRLARSFVAVDESSCIPTGRNGRVKWRRELSAWDERWSRRLLSFKLKFQFFSSISVWTQFLSRMDCIPSRARFYHLEK